MMIKTKRLVIRPFTQADLPEFERLLAIPELPGFQMQLPRSRAFLDWQIANYEKMDICTGAVCFGIFQQAGGLLGGVGAGEHDDLHEPEIFYFLLPEARGQGYAKEAACAMTRWVMETFDIPHLIGTADVENTASQRVLDFCGYRYLEEKELRVHITGTRHRFRYYRYERQA